MLDKHSKVVHNSRFHSGNQLVAHQVAFSWPSLKDFGRIYPRGVLGTKTGGGEVLPLFLGTGHYLWPGGGGGRGG